MIDINEFEQRCFYVQLVAAIVLGFVLVVIFGWVFSRRDSKGGIYKKWKKIVTMIMSFLNFGLAIVMMVSLIVNMVNGKMIAWPVAYIFPLVSLGVYFLRFKPSPRGLRVKIRKIIAYYLICGLYMTLIIVNIYRICWTLLGMPNIGGYDAGHAAGTFFAFCMGIGLTYLLLKKYKKDKYKGYEPEGVQTDLLQEQHSVLPQPTQQISVIPEFNSGKQSQVKRKVIKKKEAALTTIMSNKKKAGAIYIAYEMVILVLFIIALIILISEENPVWLPIVLFVLLSGLPIGIYWALRLWKEATNVSDNEFKQPAKVIPELNSEKQLQEEQKGLKKKEAVLTMIISNRKRAGAIYIAYEMIILVFFIIALIILILEESPVWVSIVLFLLLSGLPVGIYCAIKLWKEATNVGDNELKE